MIIKLGLNGLNSLGLNIFKETKKRSQFKVVAINDDMKNDYIAYKLKYESMLGHTNFHIEVINNDLIVDGDYIKILNKELLNWGDYDVDAVIESTGKLYTKESNEKHLKYGAKKVCLTYIPSDNIPMFIMGVNDNLYKNENIISIANSTINCISVLSKIIHDNFEITECLINNFYSGIKINYKDDDFFIYKKQKNIYPCNIKYFKYIEKIIPSLKNKIIDQSFYIPINNVSFIDFNVLIKNKTSLNEICLLIKNKSKKSLKGIIDYNDIPFISSNIFNYNKCTSIFDKTNSLSLNGNYFKLSTWYNNEYAISNKLLDFIKKTFNNKYN